MLNVKIVQTKGLFIALLHLFQSTEKLNSNSLQNTCAEAEKQTYLEIVHRSLKHTWEKDSLRYSSVTGEIYISVIT